MCPLVDSISADLRENNGKISQGFIDNLADNAEKIYLHPTPSMRICVLRIYSGHETVGVAQVLDPKNDNEEIGNKVAYNNAKNELWSVVGSIAKTLQGGE